ncbi:nitroreductase/quinone reductase family protein [Gordonia soli]|uniref:Nitroreductase family deazaflavin-dependent oxidoreductase n=1 Tax=Gordonia soli NBRC 108243 TaxID=1223545 RepID=M0QKR4_9ACTN|nr:nitroreductase/quinone reductase family protein [Gordonia soli]GAC69153.1 hypothetical protein GS4_20_02190 [Gordonia soli NBRC 108243]
MNTFQRVAKAVNTVVFPLLRLPGVGPLLGKGMTVISYTGRKSGKTFELPVSYSRTGESLRVGVAAPDKKNWWRNFEGAGGDVTVTLPEGPRSGHAVAARDDKGRIWVTIELVAAA